MSHQHIHLTDELQNYLRSVSLHEPEVLQRLREETSRLELGRMQITPEQGQFMRLLVRLLGVRKAIEVGTFTGYSSTSVALGLPEDGKLICCDVNAEWTAKAHRAWREAGVDNKVELRLAPAAKTLDELIANGGAGTFDFAFIDADKTGYWNYLERLHVLLRKGGLVLVDNVLWHGRPADPAEKDADTQAIRDFNQRLASDQRFSISMLPIGDGLTLAMKL